MTPGRNQGVHCSSLLLSFLPEKALKKVVANAHYAFSVYSGCMWGFVKGIPLSEWYSMVVNINIDSLVGSVEDLHLFILQASIWKFVDKYSDY